MWSSDEEYGCEYIYYALGNSRQVVVLQLGVWLVKNISPVMWKDLIFHTLHHILAK
jgi:hypothetical protein